MLVLNVIFVMKMMPPTTKCVCGQVRTRRDMSDQLTRSIRPMQSNRANQGAFYTTDVDGEGDGEMMTVLLIRLMKPVWTNNGTFLRYDDYVLLSPFLC